MSKTRKSHEKATSSKPMHPEELEQIAFIEFITKYGYMDHVSAIYHTANQIKAPLCYKHKLQRMGVRPGVPDITILVHAEHERCTYAEFIEFKKPELWIPEGIYSIHDGTYQYERHRKNLSPNQVIFADRIKNVSVHYGWHSAVYDFVAIMEEYVSGYLFPDNIDKEIVEYEKKLNNGKSQLKATTLKKKKEIYNLEFDFIDGVYKRCK